MADDDDKRLAELNAEQTRLVERHKIITGEMRAAAERDPSRGGEGETVAEKYRSEYYGLTAKLNAIGDARNRIKYGRIPAGTPDVQPPAVEADPERDARAAAIRAEHARIRNVNPMAAAAFLTANQWAWSPPRGGTGQR